MESNNQVTCIFCAKSAMLENGLPQCDCEGNYFQAPLDSVEIKVSCPTCQRNLLLGRETFGHKLACSCDTYICVLEEPENPIDISVSKLGEEVEKPKFKVNSTQSRSTKSSRRKQKKSKAPLVGMFIGLVMIAVAYYLFSNSGKFQAEQRVATTKSEKTLAKPEKLQNKALSKEDEVAVKEVSENSAKSVLYQAKDLSQEELESIIDNFDKIDSAPDPKEIKVDLGRFSSLRSKALPNINISKNDLKISDYKNHLQPFFNDFCIECHGPEKQKGGMRLDKLSTVFNTPADVQHWQDVLDTLNGAQMPPKKSKQPSISEMSQSIRSLTESLTTARLHFASQKGVATVRRLNRREYQRSIYDLLGVKVSVDSIPEDNLYDSFDTVGEALTISPFQVRQYFKTAEEAVKQALSASNESDREPELYSFEVEDLLASRIDKELKKVKKNIQKQTDLEKDIETMPMQAVLKKYRQADEVGLKNRLRSYTREGINSAWSKYVEMETTKKGGLLFPYSNGFNGNLQRFEFDLGRKIPQGEYILRVHAALHKPKVKAAYLKISHGDRKDSKMIATMPVYQALDEGQVFETKFKVTGVNKDSNLILTAPLNMLVPQDGHKISKRGDKQSEGIDGIWIDRLELIGPLAKDRGVLNLSDKDEKELSLAEPKAKKILEGFAGKAFRGSKLSDAYIDRLMKVFREEFTHKKSMYQALIRPLSTVLCSGHFLYMVEESTEIQAWVNDRELAVRLSYFLWSSMPDEELLRLAHKDILHRPEVLKSQIDRMLKSKKFKGFIEGFVNQWFELEKLMEIAVNQDLYPSYNDAVKMSSILETEFFVKELFQKNLSLENLIKSDFTIVDDSMALFYGLDLTGKGGFRTAKLDAHAQRGGLLSQSSILSMTSNGDRTSPVERGAYVLKKFLNRPKMLPPPNVPQLDIDLGKQTDTVRKSIAQHSELPQCASCHDLIDPLGFGMENFNTVGHWRMEETIPVNKRKVKSFAINAQGQLPDGTQFNSFVEMREGLLAQKDDMVKALIKALLTYGLGRPVGFQDSQLVEDIFQHTVKNEYGAKALLYAVVASDAFHLK